MHLLILLLLVPGLAQAQWSRTPQELLAMAKAATAEPDKNTVILDEETRYSIDAAGRTKVQFRQAYHLRTAEAVEDWDTVSVNYAPWHQRKPVVRARVITKDGQVHHLEASTLTDSPTQQFEADIYSDGRILSGPLPAVAEGAVVEWEYQLEDTAPFFEQGSVGKVLIGNYVPVVRVRMEIDAPQPLNAQVVARLLPANALQRSESGGRVKWSLDMSPGPKVQPQLPMLPSDVPTRPYVAFSTASGWNRVAAGYAAMVDEQIAGADLAALGLKIDAVGKSREQVIEELLRRVHRQVRYVGLELGDGALRPRTPAETMGRRYGDCKDKAALLVAALRGAGIPSSVALLNAGEGWDVDPQLPGLGVFNHAIAYIPGSPAIWVDVTAEHARLRTLPSADEDRWALVASAGTQELIKTPVSEMAENVTVVTREFWLKDPGQARMVETIEASGKDEIAYRSVYAREETKEMRDSLNSYAKSSLLSEANKILEHPAAHEFAKPFKVRWEASASGRGVVEHGDGVVAVLASPLIDELPYWFKLKNDEKPDDDASREFEERQKNRQEVFVLPRAYRSEMRYLITPPPFFKAKELPATETEMMGPAKLVKEYSTGKDGRISAVLRFELPKTHLTPAEAHELREKATEFMARPAILIGLVHEAEEKLALGQIREGLAGMKAAIQTEPAKAIHYTRLARGYVQAGLGRLARETAAKGVELEPKSAEAYYEQAIVLKYDLYGQPYARGWDQAGVEKALRKMLELEPESVKGRLELAVAYEHDVDGLRYSSRAQMNKALEEYKRIGAKLQSSGADQNYAIALMRLGRYAEMDAAVAKMANYQLGRALHYVGAAARQGPATAIVEIQRDVMNATGRAQMLAFVGVTLTQIRKYPEAAELLKASTRSAANAGLAKQAEVLAKTKRAELLTRDPKDPSSPVQGLMHEFLSLEPSREKMAKFFINPERALSEVQEEAKSGDAVRDGLFRATQQMKESGISFEVMRDMALSGMTATNSGDDAKGYRIELTNGIAGGGATTFYVIKKGDEYRVAGGGGAAETARSALDLMMAGNTPAAEQLMDWLAEETPQDSAGDDVPLPPMRYLWAGVLPKDRNAQTLQVAAAAAIVAKDAKSETQMETLKTALPRAKIGKDRLYILTAMIQGYAEAKKWPEMLVAARQLSAAAPKSGVAFGYLVDALLANGLPAEAKLVAAQRLKTMAQKLQTNVPMEDEASLKALAKIAMAARDWKTAAGHYETLAKQRNFNEELKGDATWLRVRAALPGALPYEIAERSTLAALPMGAWLASQGKVAEARQQILRDAGSFGVEASAGPMLVVQGQIAEAVGEPDEAKRFYREIPMAGPSAGFAERVAATFRVE